MMLTVCMSSFMEAGHCSFRIPCHLMQNIDAIASFVQYDKNTGQSIGT